MSKSATRAVLVIILIFLVGMFVSMHPPRKVYVPAYPVQNPHPVYDQPVNIPLWLLWGGIGYAIGNK